MPEEKVVKAGDVTQRVGVEVIRAPRRRCG